MIFWDVMYSYLIDGVQCFWIPFCFKQYFERAGSIHTFLREIGTCLSDYPTSHPRRSQTLHSALWETQITYQKL